MRNSFAVDHRRSIESNFRTTMGPSGPPRGKQTPRQADPEASLEATGYKWVMVAGAVAGPSGGGRGRQAAIPHHPRPQQSAATFPPPQASFHSKVVCDAKHSVAQTLPPHGYTVASSEKWFSLYISLLVAPHSVYQGEPVAIIIFVLPDY